MRFAFAGTSAFAASCLRGLLAEDLEIALVISQPDRPTGRRRVLAPPPVATAACELGLPLVQPEQAAEAGPALHAANASAVAICAYGQLIPRSLLDAQPWLNLHPSILPRWRGAAPIERAILAGDAETGAAVMRLVPALDAGGVLAQTRFAIGPRDDAGAVMERSLADGGPRLAEALRTAGAGGDVEGLPQSADGVTYAAKLTAADRLLEPAGPVGLADRTVRALSPHVGAVLALGEERFTIWRAHTVGEELAAGAVEVDGNAIRCGFADGVLVLERLQAPGRRPLEAAELLRGWRTPPTVARRAAP